MSKVAKATIGLMIVTILSKCLGFGRELVLASAYGASSFSDAYITAMNIPVVIFAAVGSALGTTIIPLYYEINSLNGRERALKFFNNIFNIVAILSLIVAILGFIFVEPLVKVIAMGFKGETFRLTVEFTRIFIFGIVFVCLSNLLTAYLQINNNFIIPGIIGMPFSFIIIVSIVLSINTNMHVLAFGTLIAIASQFLFQVPFAIKYNYKYSTTVNIKDEYVKKMMILIAPIFIGVFVNQLNTLIDRTLASTLVEGSISALNYANRLNGFVMGIFIVSIVSVIYPRLSKLSSSNNKDEFAKTIVTSINSVILLVIPVSVGAIVLANPIIKILFERGEFDSNATKMTAIALVFYSIGMVAFGLRDVLSKIFYSFQDTKTPMKNGIITVILNIILNLIFVKFMGHAGLAFATSLSALICTGLLFISLSKKMGNFGQSKIISVTVKSLIAASLMGIVIIFYYNVISNILGIGFIQQAISLFSSILLGMIVYGGVIYFMKIEEINVIINSIKSKIK